MGTAPIIRTIPVGSYGVKTYLLICPQTRAAALIDPGGDADKILALIQAEGARVKYILNTHGHADHVVANQQLKSALSAPVCMHEDDDRFFAQAEIQKKTKKELGLPPPDPADQQLNHGQVLSVGALKIAVIHTPGHTPGSVCFLVAGNLFTGDTLFVGDVGRTDLTGGSLERLLESLAHKILTLPKETVIWPGHDYGETETSTVGREMAENPYITDFILDEG